MLIDWLWFVLVFKKRTNLLYNKLLTFEQDSFSLMKKVAKENGFPFRENINYQLSLGTGFKNIPVFKLSPRDFDFPRKPKQNHYYVGPLVDLEREKKISDLRYLEIIKRVAKNKKERVAKNKKEQEDIFLIYCSLGTVTNAEMKLCDIFLKK